MGATPGARFARRPHSGDVSLRSTNGSVNRTARLVGLAHVWIEAKVTHPATLRGDVELDAAAVAAIPKVEAAQTKQAYAAAIDGMLAVLHDPATHVSDPETAPTPPAVPAAWIERPSPKLVIVTVAALAQPANADKVGELVATLPGELAGAEIAVIDLRAPGLEAGVGYFIDNAAAALPPVTQWPASITVVHHGYRTQEGFTSGGYDSTYSIAPRIASQPGHAGIKHVVFVADSRAALPDVALGLQASGRATIVSSDKLDDSHTAKTVDVELPYGLVAHVRSELIVMPDHTAISADVIVPARTSPHAAAVALATKLLGGAAPPRRHAGPAVPLALPSATDDRDWPEAALPSRELRIFAAIKAWGVLSRFYPYLDLVADWDSQLAPAITQIEAATTDTEYRDALLVMGAHLHDGHVWVYHLPRQRIGTPQVEVRLVEGKPIITATTDGDALTSGQLHLGDELVSLDGVSLDKRREQLRATQTAGTTTARENRVLESALFGPPEQPATLELRGADRVVHTVKLARDVRPPTVPAPHWKLLPNRIGYADLTALTEDEVDPMFAALGKTTAIILDMRGYPNGTAWPIAPYLNIKHAVNGAAFSQPLVRAGDHSGRTPYLQPLPEDASKPVYQGKVAVLIDDRAVSQAEHSCLFFEAAAGATFIGTHTHGTNGDITTMRLPGALRMTFTGQAVSHVDGRQLQQIGIVPQIEIAPTVAGVRAGKDEVLDRAVTWAKTGR